MTTFDQAYHGAFSMGNETRSREYTILVIDDSPDNLLIISKCLQEFYRVKVTKSGEDALQILQESPLPDLILLDIVLPGMDGYSVCTRLKQNRLTRDIPVIFLTGRTDVADENRGFDLGAVDYITKPISPMKLRARIKTQLSLKASADFLKDKNDYLESEIYNRTREVLEIQDVTIMTIASLAETRDNETGRHIRRTQLYVRILAEKLRSNPRFVAINSDRHIDLLFKSAPLHDIGKVGIPDSILLKPGKLDSEEFNTMKKHTSIGFSAIQHAEDQLGRQVDFLTCAKEITFSHHEKWDGSGYPEGLSGEAIPVSARLMALADVYDSLISNRVYRNGMSHDETRKIILEGRGTHFDPDIVDAFIALEDNFRSIAEKISDIPNK
jgi:putative two-component system response regulator